MAIKNMTKYQYAYFHQNNVA